jgi:uncharacterized protein (TIGR03067 family)
MRRVVPLLIVLSLGFAPAPVYREKPVAATTDLKALQGDWKATLYNGEDPAIYWKGFKLIVRANRATFHTARGKAGLDGPTWVFTTDTRASPKAITLRDQEKPFEYFYRCIYRLEGDRLTLSVPHRDDTPRLVDFSINRDATVWVFSRLPR